MTDYIDPSARTINTHANANAFGPDPTLALQQMTHDHDPGVISPTIDSHANAKALNKSLAIELSSNGTICSYDFSDGHAKATEVCAPPLVMRRVAKTLPAGAAFTPSQR